MFLSHELKTLGFDHPVTVFVLGMCLYAGERSSTAAAPAPYRDHDARAHVRARLIPVEVLLESADLPVGRAAAALNVPVDELCVVRADAEREHCGGRSRRLDATLMRRRC